MGKKTNITREGLMKMDVTFLRSLLRERVHHKLEGRIYDAVYKDKAVPANAGESIKEMLSVLKEKGGPADSADVEWASTFLALGDAIRQGEKPELDASLPQPFSATELEVVQKLIVGRRSISDWTDDDIPSQAVDSILEAGLWAPHSCNLQNTRFIVVREQQDLAVLRGSERRGFKLAIVVCQDMRSYENFSASLPEVNWGLDCGAAVQNMLLMAHALGLAATWMTFVGRQKSRVREHYQLPDSIRVVTYVVLGWPARGSISPGRIAVSEARIR